MDIKNLSLEEKIGQRFMFGVNSDNVSVIVDLIKNFYIGGVILYKKNYSSYEEMISVVKKLKDANKNNKIPLFISIDQEGGRVNRLPSEIENFKSSYNLSKKGVNLIYESSCLTAELLSSVGINMNFSPVMDIYGEKGKVLYNRCFFGDIDEVSLAGVSYIRGMRDNNIISVPKHFPGHGATDVDSHLMTPYVYNYNKILSKHMLPFENAINNGIDALMVGHLVIRKLTNGLPASISSNFVNNFLRKRNNFNGIVITDEINMLSRNIFYKFNYIYKSFSSASDIILVKINGNGNRIIDKYKKFLWKHKEHNDFLNCSVERIIKLKEKYNITDDLDFSECNIDKINEKIRKINEMCNK